MQRRRMILAVLMMMVGAAWTLQAQARNPKADKGKGQADKGGWVLMGQRPVTDKIDHDTVTVTRAAGVFGGEKYR